MKKILTLMLAAVMMLGLAACDDEYYYGDDDAYYYDDRDESCDDEYGGSGTQSVQGSYSEFSSVIMSLDDDGNISITRPERDETVPMGEDGTWTIFVYLCGTDLESGNGMAAMDLEEMENASTGGNVRFVVQTGGTEGWTNYVDESICQRYEISDGKTALVDETTLAGMGQSSTLADFLVWGVTNYGAANMGLILWDHGGGSITGVCFDEMDGYDSLSLRELDAALLSAYEVMTDSFTFIGFDACLMSTVEYASLLASYADYMYASEETEPGYGWDYEAIGSFLGENPNTDGEALGRVVADSFYEACGEIGEESLATMAVIDLSKIDALLTTFNAYAQSLYSVTEDSEVLSRVVRSAISADNFGGNNKSEGYTNMVDLAGIVEAGADYADGTEQTLAAIEDAVVYVRNGSEHPDACGLAAYYPLEIQGTEELSVFGQIAVSPYYLSFVARAAYGAVNGGDTGSYDNTEALDFWGFFEYSMDDDGYYEDSYDYYEEYSGAGDYWSYYDGYEQTGESPLITFDEDPTLDEYGSYGFTLTAETLALTASVQASVYELSEDGEDLIELGVSVDILMDWDSGTFCDNFDGCWFSLPDGQNLAVYVVSEGDGYDVYTSPVYLNGEETNLRITHDYTTGEITIEGAWDGIDEYGSAAREVTPLSEGDEIIPIYYAYAIDSDEEYYYIGEGYVFDGAPEIYYSWLPDGEYFYGFFIDDIYGDYYITDYMQFSVEGEDVYYYEY